MNPALPRDIFIPDSEARVMPDGRLHVYGSLDMSGDTEFCSTSYLGFSTGDGVHWEKDGIIFSTDPGEQAEVYGYSQPLTLGAPDCVYKDQKYYLYYCTYGNGERVAVADRPEGPFQDLGPVVPADGDGIDPAVLVDEDGSVYYFWGQYSLKGGKLKEDMLTIDSESIRENILTEHEHGFHEGASIRKISHRYYMVYTDISRGKATCLSYAISNHPFGPYEKQGVIIDNIGCDSENWNNHGSIECFQGDWYVFYHRSSQNSIYNRRLCIEPIIIQENGRIEEVIMTSGGISGDLSAFGRIDASIACRLRQSIPFFKKMSLRIEPRAGMGEVIAYTSHNDWAEYRYLDFGKENDEMTLVLRASSKKPALIEVMIEGGEKIGQCRIGNTGGWDRFEEFSCPIKPVNGVHTLWLVIKSDQLSVGRLADLDHFQFYKNKKGEEIL